VREEGTRESGNEGTECREMSSHWDPQGVSKQMMGEVALRNQH
jgi:hypothetical protein